MCTYRPGCHHCVRVCACLVHLRPRASSSRRPPHSPRVAPLAHHLGTSWLRAATTLAGRNAEPTRQCPSAATPPPRSRSHAALASLPRPRVVTKGGEQWLIVLIWPRTWLRQALTPTWTSICLQRRGAAVGVAEGDPAELNCASTPLWRALRRSRAPRWRRSGCRRPKIQAPAEAPRAATDVSDGALLRLRQRSSIAEPPPLGQTVSAAMELGSSGSPSSLGGEPADK